ncbi:unnamed protein product, partial [Adineta ricciae]
NTRKMVEEIFNSFGIVVAANHPGQWFLKQDSVNF